MSRDAQPHDPPTVTEAPAPVMGAGPAKTAATLASGGRRPGEHDQFSEIGAIIDRRYRVEAHLGRGGMAAVYRVADQSTGRRLALEHSAS